MTEITRVPLQPIAKGSVSKIWLGTLAAVLIGGTVAVAAKPPLVSVKTIHAGEGPNPTTSDLVMVDYVGKLSNGTVFDQNKNAILAMTNTIPGFIKGMAQTQKGGEYVIKIPAKLAYGDQAAGPIPANSDLTFNIKVLDIRNRAEIEAQRRMMEQMMRSQGGAAGAAGAAPKAEEAPAQ